jgi:fido (protein-threonine AMPylation protein)
LPHFKTVDMDTELKLTNWREGQTKAERLAANLLDLDGFTAIDPQCPLGGPDGIKDVICEKNGWKYVGAAYFPTTIKDFKAIKKKFDGDLKGVTQNKVDGIVFVTNQKLSPSERATLIKEAKNKKATALIYHVEKIRVLLDSPQGFALRLTILGIEMTKEEQLSFFSDQRNYLKKLLNEQSEYIIKSIGQKLDVLKTPSDKIFSFMQNINQATQSTIAYLKQTIPKTDKRDLVFPKISIVTSELNTDLLCLLHKAILFETNNGLLGQLRKSKVWIGPPNSTLNDATYIPPDPDQVDPLTEKLLSDWRNVYPTLLDSKDKNLVLREISKFHSKFLAIHPFLDGNGRIARFLLTQQASELLDSNKQIILEDKEPYFLALDKANKGDIEPLKRIITQAIFGTDEIKNEA